MNAAVFVRWRRLTLGCTEMQGQSVFDFLFSQTKLLTQYVLNLAKYDQNYDIRDRARFIRQLIVPTEKSGALSKYAKKLFLALKPAPVLESPFKGTESH